MIRHSFPSKIGWLVDDRRSPPVRDSGGSLRSSPATQRKHQARRRAGYTLLEMLISVALVSVLMTAVWQLVSMYTALQTAGEEVTVEQQLVRSTFQLIQEDLTAVALQPAKAVSIRRDPFAGFDDPFDTPTSPDDSSPGMIFGSSDSGRTAGPPVVSLRGTEATLQLTFLAPSAPQAAPGDIDLLNELGGGSASEGTALPDGTSPVVEEFQTVTWQFAAPGLQSGEGALPHGLFRIQATAGDVQRLSSQRSAAEQEQMQDELRLTRDSIERLLFPQAEGAEDQSSQHRGRRPVVDLIPEVAGCRFEYFAEDHWVSEWTAELELPRAIRVSVDVLNADQQRTLKRMFSAELQKTRLDEYLNRMRLRTAPPPQQTGDGPDPESVRLVPTRYRSVLLLDSAGELRLTRQQQRETLSQESLL